jgi:hypothetical protein
VKRVSQAIRAAARTLRKLHPSTLAVMVQGLSHQATLEDMQATRCLVNSPSIIIDGLQMLATAAQSEAAIALACADGNLKLDSEDITKRFQKTACQTKHQNLASSHTRQAGQHSINTICGSVVFRYLCAYAKFQTRGVPSITVAYTHTCCICFTVVITNFALGIFVLVTPNSLETKPRRMWFVTFNNKQNLVQT